MDLLKAAVEGDLPSMQKAITYGADLESRDDIGLTALHWTASGGFYPATRWLIERGANIESVNKGGRTPLHWACRRGRITVIRLLVQKGANVHHKSNNGQQPLHWASQYGQHNVVRFLLTECGARIDVCDNEGRTAIDVAKGPELPTLMREWQESGSFPIPDTPTSAPSLSLRAAKDETDSPRVMLSPIEAGKLGASEVEAVKRTAESHHTVPDISQLLMEES